MGCWLRKWSTTRANWLCIEIPEVQQSRKNLRTAPWHVGEIFDSVDDSYNHWNTLFSKISVEHLPMKRMRGQFLFETQKMMPHEKENLQETVLWDKSSPKGVNKLPQSSELQPNCYSLYLDYQYWKKAQHWMIKKTDHILNQ